MSAIPTDLAAKVIGADLRNLIKKVSEGGVLSPPERELMQHALSGEITDELKQARRAALIRKWATGGKLNQEEQEEVGSVLPDGRGASRQVTSDRYKRKIRDYVGLLQAAGMPVTKDATRKLKAWIHAGRYDATGAPRDPPDLPPFDQFDQLAAWWRRCMKYGPPDYIEKMEREAAEEAPSNASPPPAETPPAAGDKKAAPKDDVIEYGEIEFNEEVSGDIGVKVARSFVLDGLRRFAQARKEQNFKLARLIRDDLRDDIEDLRKQEASALKLLEGKGEYLRARVLLTDANRLFAMMSISFYNALELIAKKANPLLPASERRDLALAQRDVVFEHLQQTSFAEAWQPETDSLAA